MGKRILSSLLMCLILSLALAGCSSSSSNTATEKANIQTADKQNTPVATGENSPEQNKQNSNPQNIGDPKQNTGSNNPANPAEGRKSPDLFGQVKSVKGNDVTVAVAQMPQREKSAPPQEPPAGQADNVKQGPPEMSAPSLTGENKTITIPADIKIISGRRDDTKEISVGDLKEGDMIEVYYKDGEDTVESVRVMQSQL